MIINMRRNPEGKSTVNDLVVDIGDVHRHVDVQSEVMLQNTTDDIKSNINTTY